MRTISKSQYCKGRKCLKRIWLYNYRKDLIEETSTFQESIFTQGKEVGMLACRLFPEGVLIDDDYKHLDGALLHTQVAVERNAKAIFEGAFIYDNVLIRVDILVRNDDDTYDLIEVKSSTKVKEKEHLPDCAIQTYVLQRLGFNIRKICIAHLNNKYVKEGELDISKLFIIQPVNDLLENELNLVPEYLAKISHVLSKDEEPSWRLGTICKTPYPCEFKHYCWKDITEKSIHYLYNIRDKLRFQLIDMNIMFVKDIPESMVNESQITQIRCEKTQLPFIDKGKITEHLRQLQYPLYFLDFETLGYAIPQYNGTRPYQKLPFQYSLHVKQNPESPLEHYEFLFEQNANPMRPIAERLVNDIGPVGSIIVYNKSFEKDCLQNMAKACPDLSPSLENIIERLWDLYDPFAKKWFYDPNFNGSASIKKVMPVLVPELSYDTLDICEGDDAQAMYLKFITQSVADTDREKIRRDLIEYCKLDTLGMVRILDELQKVTSSNN